MGSGQSFSRDEELEPTNNTTNTSPATEPAPQLANTSDGPAGGDPDEFEELTGISSDWSINESDNEESGGGSVDALTLGGGAAVATRPFWPSVAAWFAGLFSAPVVATVVGALLPSATGGGRQTHDIEGTDHTIQINGDMSVGEVYDANGRPTGIQVSMTDVDENGRPTGFTPLTEEDAQALGALTGTTISTGTVLDTTLNSDNVGETEATDGSDETGVTGNEALDEVLDGTIATDDGNKGLETPSTKEEFEQGLRDIPGVQVREHGGPGIEATLPDGTVVSTYPSRDSTGHPGYQVKSPNGKTTHKGSLVGSK